MRTPPMIPIEIPVNKKTTHLLIACTPLGVAFGLWCILYDFGDDPNGATLFCTGIVTTVLCAVAFCYAVLKLIRYKPGFTIDDIGIIDNSTVLSMGRIAWKDIESFSDLEREKLIYVSLKDNGLYISPQKSFVVRWRLKLTYGLRRQKFRIFCPILQIPYKELLTLLQQQHNLHNDTHKWY